MAEINNLNEINENFDTIKTLLNSIRAQGILNTSDVDKLLSGINSKLEKINTDEDVDLIKIFLTELKQNLEERHSVLISKFAAIESLFSNLLKNSSEMLKSSEVKELFDIVATNLSVFSREVVSQKETLGEISLRLDAIQSDDSKKNDVIKNITVLKNDIDRISNGFDSIVISLNENFKTVIKTISEIDKTDSIVDFGDQIKDIVASSNTILSALQLIDKKQIQLEEAFSNLATQDDINSTKRSINEVSVINKQISDSIETIVDKGYKLDTLAEKIDASVNIIAGLKSVVSEIGEKNSLAIVDRLNEIEQILKQTASNDEFADLKGRLETVIHDVINNCVLSFNTTGDDIKEHITDETGKVSQLVEAFSSRTLDSVNTAKGDIEGTVKASADRIAGSIDENITKTISDINSNAEVINTKLNEAHTAITDICRTNFADLLENLSGLKIILSQIDENNTSANNAIYSNLTDRLAMFENSLKSSLERQEGYVSNSSEKVVDQMAEVKNLSGTLEYKLDASIIEINNSKKEFEDLKTAVQDVLNLDFVSTVKDLRVDLYAVKQDIAQALEGSSSDLSEKFSNDLFGKYELLISKLDMVSDEVNKVQYASLEEIKARLENISSGIVDVLSYVSVRQDNTNEALDSKIKNLINAVNDSRLNYVESVRDVVDVIKVQIQNKMDDIYKQTIASVDSINSSIEISAKGIRDDIQNSYDKLVSVQENFDEIKDLMNVNNVTNRTDIENILDSAQSLKGDFEAKLTALKNTLLDKVTEFKNEFACENADKISELKFNSENLHSKAMQNAVELKTSLKEDIENITNSLRDSILELSEQVAASSLKNEGSAKDVVDYIKNDFARATTETIDELSSSVTGTLDQVDGRLGDVSAKLEEMSASVDSLSKETTNSLTMTLSKILENFVSIKSEMNVLNDKSSQSLKNNVDDIKENFDKLKEEFKLADANLDEDMSRQIDIIEHNFQALNSLVSSLMDENKAAFTERIEAEFEAVSQRMSASLNEKLEGYKSQIEDMFDKFNQTSDSRSDFMKEKALELNRILEETLAKQSSLAELQISDIAERLKSVLDENIKLTAADYEALRTKFDECVIQIQNENRAFTAEIKTQLEDIGKFIDSGLSIQAQEVNNSFEQINSGIYKITSTMKEVNNEFGQKVDEASNNIVLLRNQLGLDISGLSEKLYSMFEENSLNFLTQITNTGSSVTDELKTKALEIKGALETLNERIDKDEVSRMNIYQSQIKELSDRFNVLISEAKDVTKTEVASVCETLISSNKYAAEEMNNTIDSKINTILAASADISAGELQSIQSFAAEILENVDSVKQNVITCREIVSNLVKDEIKNLTKNIQKESDAFLGDVIEQFDILKSVQKDDLSAMTSQMEGSVSGYIYDAVNDIKSYLDIKTDTSIVDGKIDSLRVQLENTAETVIDNMNKLLELSVFADAISDLKSANEAIVNSMAEKLNAQVEDFIKTNLTKSLGDKLNLFDKKFTDTLVNQYEEIKLISSSQGEAFASIKQDVQNIISDFNSGRDDINSKLQSVIDGFNYSIDELKQSFENLRSQIMDKSFDEAFELSINNKINGLENLVQEQTGYLEDINELCCSNLPEISEMSAVLKHGIQQSIADLTNKLDSKELDISLELNNLKTDVITQFLNIFNQISFVAEQEEIIDFIQEKHSELITILSHIVTTSDTVENVKDNLAVVDNKMNSLKEDVDLINEKITAIMSSDGDINYVYSLQDLESDIANLRLVLNEMKQNLNSKEDVEEFKKNFNTLAEDIVSISTRTNKLILASDESHQTLQDSLQDFKLVINDLDERTRNFAQDAGIDKINNKLGAINTMMQNGEKTNQIFNQVFEYLAEWVDKAGAQISSITDKVETLDDLGQIKVMLEDMKAESEDDSSGNELVEALGNVFDKQSKRISSLEAKLDRVIVDTTINSRQKLDVTPFEDTLNRFLVAIDDKMVSQQKKINSLEEKLEEVMSLVDNKETAQLTKKVGGMDRQIAKLNKSIEKIASHVVEK